MTHVERSYNNAITFPFPTAIALVPETYGATNRTVVFMRLGTLYKEFVFLRGGLNSELSGNNLENKLQICSAFTFSFDLVLKEFVLYALYVIFFRKLVLTKRKLLY